MQNLKGKVVWITGASSGLGEALAHSCAARGARLILSARRQDRLQAVAQATGASEVELLPFDLAELAALPARAAQALARMGRVDVMVHNAGIGQRGLALETAPEVERRLMDVNFFAPVALTKALLPAMIAAGGGQLVLISSVLGLISVQRRAGYCASKHALHGYFNALRAELHAQRVRVLLVCPGHIRSEFARRALEADGRPHGVDDGAKGLAPSACAERTLRALARGDDEIYPAQWEQLGVYASRFAPGLLRRLTARLRAR